MENYKGTTIMVVEYLESTMSKELLCKFPDNSPFDFDYTQSSLWSPLLPRPSLPYLNSRIDLTCGLSRNLFSGSNGSVETKRATTLEKVTANMKRKFTKAVFHNLCKYQRIKNSKKAAIDYSPVPSSNKLASAIHTPRKGWAKVLKAASKQFKKNKKKDSTSVTHINLSSYFPDGDL